MLFAQCNKKNNQPPYSPTDIFTTVWNNFDKTYPYFIHKKIDWDSIFTVYNSKINDNTSPQELFETIGEMTLLLKDIHVNFNSSFGTFNYSKKNNYPENPPENALNYLSTITLDNTHVIYGRIKNTNFSYFRIKTFSGSVSSFYEAVSILDSLEKTDGLIIDIRHNGGGNELIGRALAGRFIQSKTLYKYTRVRKGADRNSFKEWNPSYFSPNKPLDYAKKIILLTNRRVYSSSELFTLMMITYPGLTIVGDTTGGASANPSQKKLPNGWTYRISTWQAANLNFDLLEDNGIAPDHCVLMTQSSIAEGKDLIMEKAIELLEKEH